MANGFDVILESLRNAKKSAIEQYAAFGKRHPILKYPLFVLIVSFIFISNFFLNLMIQMHSHKNFSKGLAYVLTAALVVSSISFTSLADDVEPIPVKITAFSSLSSEVAEQNLYVGDEESKISFPTSLNVTIEKTEVVTTKQVKENEEKAELAGEPKTDEINAEVLNPQSNTQEVQTGETTPVESVPEVGANIEGQDVSESPEGTIPESEGEPIDELVPDSENNPESEPQQDEALQDPVDESIDNQDDREPADEGEIPDDQARSILSAILPSITVYAAEPSEIPEGESVSETPTETPEGEVEYEIITETVTSSEEAVIDGITWIIDAGNSSAEVFSSENAGAKFVYVPVISGGYDIAAELSRITVNIIAKEENVEGVSFAHSENIAGYNISIDAPAGVFPEGTTVSINVVSNPVSLIEGELSDDRNIQQIITFDISFWHDGVEIEPENGKVNVSISLASDMKETLQEETSEIQVFHIDDDRNIEEVACSSNGEEVSFSADEFSDYSVVTTTGNEKTKLATPILSWVEGETMTLSWNAVEHATGYRFYLSPEGKNTGISSGTSETRIDLTSYVSDMENTLQESLDGVQINVELTAYVGSSSVDNLLYFDSDKATANKIYRCSSSKTKLSTPVLRWVEGETMTLSWNAVEHATGYRFYLSPEGKNTGISSGTSETGIDLTSYVSDMENTLQESLDGVQINVELTAYVGSSSVDNLLYFDSDKATISKVYIGGIVITTDSGAHIVQTDAIFDALKNSLTSEQLALAEGKELSFDLNISDLSATSEGASDISGYASSNSYTIGKFFDISLVAKADGVSIGSVSATAAAVPLAVEVPSYMQRVGRTFIILRNHEGVISEVGRGTGNQVPITTDQFSTYAIAYVDSNSGGGESSGDGSASDSSGASNDSSGSSSNNFNSSSSNASVSASTWTPKTPDEIKRYSVVGNESLTSFVDRSSGYALTMKNAMQGPNCFAAFESVLNGYTIGRTYDILPNGQRIQTTDKEVGFSIEVPKALQKEGRTFQMVCVTKGGQPIVLKDLDNNPNTITVKTNKFFAFALAYKDIVEK